VPFCPQCGVDNPPAARYCDQCGAMLIPVPGAAPAPPPAAPSSGAPLISGAPTCPQCGTPAIPGEAFCDNCGAPLGAPARPVAPVPPPPSSAGVPPQSAYPPPQPSSPQAGRLTPPAGSPPPAQPSYTPPSAGVPAPSYTPPVSGGMRSTLAPARLVAVATGAVLALPSVSQAVVGRADPVSKFFPDIDLNPYGALDQGVGRRHVRLFVLGAQVMVEDLDSTNGTEVNGQRLAPRQPRALVTGDTLVIGKLALRFQE
jgi:hypothetical protein